MSKQQQPPKPLTLKEKVLAYERQLIKEALDQCHGEPTAAARLLGGITGSGLVYIINARQKELLSERTHIRVRNNGTKK